MLASMGSQSSSFSGIVRLGVSETIVHTWLPALVRRLHADHPGVTLEISVDVSSVLSEGLSKGDIDIAFLLGPVSLPKVTNVPLGTYALGWVASTGLRFPQRPVSLDQIAEWPILTFSRASAPYHEIAMLFRRAGLQARIFPNSSLSSIVRMAVDGIGIGAVPLSALGEELAAKRLQVLTSAAELPSMTFTASFVDSPDAEMASMIAELASEIADAERAAELARSPRDITPGYQRASDKPI